MFAASPSRLMGSTIGGRAPKAPAPLRRTKGVAADMAIPTHTGSDTYLIKATSLSIPDLQNPLWENPLLKSLDPKIILRTQIVGEGAVVGFKEGSDNPALGRPANLPRPPVLTAVPNVCPARPQRPTDNGTISPCAASPSRIMESAKVGRARRRPTHCCGGGRRPPP